MKINNKNKGFSILAIILVIVAVIVAIGIWALSGDSNTATSSNSSLDAQAAAIINDGNSIKIGYDTLIINGAQKNNIVFLPGIASTPTAPNIRSCKWCSII